MSNSKPKLKSTWRRIHGLIWLLGLAILFWSERMWPGILFLVALSILYEIILKKFVPQAFETPLPQSTEPEVTKTLLPSSPQSSETKPVSIQNSNSIDHRFDLLPSVCPKCGGPIRSHEVVWSGPQSADCPYCGSNLPMDWNKQPN